VSLNLVSMVGGWNVFISQELLVISGLVCRYIVMQDEKIAIFEFFRMNFCNAFQNSFQNSFIECTNYCSTLDYKFFMNNSLVIEKNNQHYLDTWLLRTFFFMFWRVWSNPIFTLVFIHGIINKISTLEPVMIFRR